MSIFSDEGLCSLNVRRGTNLDAILGREENSGKEGTPMKSDQEREAHRRFVQALQHEHLTCAKPGCGGPMDVVDHTLHTAKIKTYEATCEQCHTVEHITGKETHQPAWDDASITLMAEAHLLHDQPICPFDETPITFVSLPNPRRKGRYRLLCYYCGRHTEMNWPPPEAKR